MLAFVFDQGAHAIASPVMLLIKKHINLMKVSLILRSHGVSNFRFATLQINMTL